MANHAKIKDSLLDEIKSMYYKEFFPMTAVAKKLKVSTDAVVYFMRKHNLERRNFSEISKIAFSKKPPTFKLKNDLCEEDKILKYLGITLYWGEGYKSKNAKHIDFANSDSKMVAVFMNFLRRICGINESKLRIYLYCYENQNPKELLKYWSNLTRIPLKNFTKPYIRKDFKEDKIGKMKNGLIHVRYYDKKLLVQVLDWIEELKTKYS